MSSNYENMLYNSLQRIVEWLYTNEWLLVYPRCVSLERYALLTDLRRPPSAHRRCKANHRALDQSGIAISNHLICNAGIFGIGEDREPCQNVTAPKLWATLSDSMRIKSSMIYPPMPRCYLGLLHWLRISSTEQSMAKTT